MLKMHYQRAHIHDGLKHLTDKEIIAKVTESPTKLKAQAKNLVSWLNKYDVRLDSEGEIDYSNITNKHVRTTLEKCETLVKVTLMHKDLEFEYPHKLEKIMVKQDILGWLDEEEEKLRQKVFQLEREASQSNDIFDNTLTYDKYYDYDPATEAQKVTSSGRSAFGSSKKTNNTTYEEFLRENESPNIFNNDLLEQEYKFWENDFDKEERLKNIWLNYKRNITQGGVDARTS